MKNLYKSSSRSCNLNQLTPPPPHLFDYQRLINSLCKSNFVSAIKQKAIVPFILLVVTLFCTNILNAQTYNLHWGSTAWGVQTYSKNITNIGGSGINAVVTILNSSPAGNVSNAGAATNDAFQQNCPTVGATGGINWTLPGSTGGSPISTMGRLDYTYQ